MKKFTTIIISFLLSIYSLNSQIRVIDGLTGEPIMFATVISIDSTFQTNTNTNGEFKLPKILDSVYVSCIGYDRMKTNATGFNSLIQLNPTSYSLSEITITSHRICLLYTSPSPRDS